MTSPVSRISSLAIGTVESVSPDEIMVLLDIDAPKNTALNTGIPTPFPKINSFVLLPNEAGCVVGTVVWLGVERSAYSKRHGFKDFGLIDLPFPLRKMTVSPIGTLFLKHDKWHLERGVRSFPCVGDHVILPTREQTVAIVTGQDSDNKVLLGSCPVAHDTPIYIDPDKLFGRHLAVLGNTGSGKSCTLAALLRSSIESVQSTISQSKIEKKNLNTRFIVLDPNGEYSKCFQTTEVGCRVFQVPPLTNPEAHAFQLPTWMWNSSEWSAIAQAAPKTQKPLLQEALRNLRSNRTNTLSIENRVLARCNALKSYLLPFSGRGAIGFQNCNNCGQQLLRFVEDISSYQTSMTGDALTRTSQALGAINGIISGRQWGRNGRIGFNDFGDNELDIVVKWADYIIESLSIDKNAITVNEDSPVPFDPEYLAEHLETLAMQEGGSTSQFISTLTMRIKGLLSDARMSDVINPQSNVRLIDWLENYIGSDSSEIHSITIIDLSLVPYEILHIIIAVASRIIFESLQRYRKTMETILPTVLVLEEAHTFIAKRNSFSDEIPNPIDMCRHIFEKIAREGRKFGLGMVLSSQRPSELSETVLSQCNSFLLHRITNDKDQQLISRLVPDNARGLLRELPSLPTRHCILLGVASQVPTLIEVKDLDATQRPASDDPDFWDVWTNKSPRPVDWSRIVADWIGGEPDEPTDS